MNVHRIYILLGFLLFSYFSFSQAVITGKVINGQNGEALEGANVILKETRLGTVTDGTGVFKLININPSTCTVAVSYLGFIEQEKQIEISEIKTYTLDFTMQPQVIEGEEIVVTATKTERAAREIPSRIDVINQSQVTAFAGQSIDDFLRNVSGLNVGRNLGIYSQSNSVSMRGLSGKDQSRVLVLVDGVPINKSDQGSVNWNLINMDMVERVEIMKGPGSALYGSNAMGGVINIITKKPEEKLQGKVTAEYGSYQTMGSHANIAGKGSPKNTAKGFYWNVNGFYRTSNGFISQPEWDRTAYTVKTFLNEKAVGTKLGYEFNENHQVNLDVNLYDDERGMGTKVYQENGEFSEHDTYQFLSRYSGNVGAFKLMANVFYIKEDYGRERESFTDGNYELINVESKREDMGLLFQASCPLAKKHTITSGADMKRGSVDASDIYYTSSDIVDNAGKMDFYALFLQDEMKFLDQKLKINAGLRFDYVHYYDGLFEVIGPSSKINYLALYQDRAMDEDTWHALSPKLSARYDFTKNVSSYLSYARGFRPSILDDLCRSGRMSGGFKVANPDLKPEILDNIEWGADFTLFDGLKISPSIYYSQGKDFMYFVSTGDSIDLGYRVSPVFKSDNISKVEIYGAELDLKYSLSNLGFFGNYTFAHSQIKNYELNDPEIDNDLTGKFLTDVPMHQFSAGITCINKYVNASLQSQYKGKQWIMDTNEVDNKYLFTDQYPSYFLVHAKLWKTLYTHWKVALTVENVFDKVYVGSKGGLSPGRFMTTSFAYIF